MSSIVENVVMDVVVEKKPKAKSFAQKDKKTLFSIMGFLLNLKEQGVLDDEKVIECLEALPLYKTAAEKTAFFQLDMFDTKKVEEELYKPMVLEHKKNKKAKKEKKPVQKKVPLEGEDVVVKEKKPRVKKVVVVPMPVEETSVPMPVEETSVPMPVEETSVPVENSVPVVKEKKPRAKKEGEGEPKRGRKPKEQIVELAQDQPNSVVEEEETLDSLIDSMTKKVECLSLNDPSTLEEIRVEDVDDMLRELEAEELIEQPQPVVAVQKKEKKVKTPVLKTGEEKPKKTKKVTVVVENPVV